MERPTRRRLLTVGGGLAAALAGCTGRRDVSDGSPGTPTDSPSRTPTDGSTPTPTDSPTPGAGEHVAWRRSVEGSVDVAPAAAAGVAYVGTAEGTVHALAGDDGTERWSVSVADPVRGVVATGDDVFAVVGTTGLGDDHQVVALGADDGTERWRFAPDEWWLTVVGARGGTVYVATGDDALAPDGQTLYAVDRGDGTARWSGEVGDPVDGLVTDEAVYVPTYGRLYAFDHDGDVRWSHEGVDYASRTLVTVGDAVAFVVRTEGG
jgi:outer membrane protein assembly factor BamB